MLEAYRQHVAERAALGIPPLPLSKQQTPPWSNCCRTRRPAKKPSWSIC
jgi:aconitase B